MSLILYRTLLRTSMIILLYVCKSVNMYFFHGIYKSKHRYLYSMNLAEPQSETLFEEDLIAHF